MADTKPDKSDHTNDHHHLPNGVGFEQSDANIKAVFGVGIAVLIFTLCCAVVINVLYSYLDERGSRRVVQPKTERAKDEPRVINDHEPPLQESPEADMRAWRAKEEARLRSYGWISKEAGVVHIPIEEAMRLTLERGLPTSNRVPALTTLTARQRAAATGLPLLDKEEVLRHSGDSNGGRWLPRAAVAAGQPDHWPPSGSNAVQPGSQAPSGTSGAH